MRSLAAPALAALACVFEIGLASCTAGVRAEAGTDAYMQVAGAQFVRGPMPQGSASGPSVEQISLIENDIWAGLKDDPIGATLAPTATAAAIGLQGDVGYWIVVAGPPGVATPADPSMSAAAEFSEVIVLGSYTLVVRAIDQDGNFGPPRTQTLDAVNSPLNPAVTGDLVVTLTWDTESNLGLHVVDPSGVDVFWGNQSSRPPFSFDQIDGGSYGTIDYDSNANCVIDGLRREDAVWPKGPPSGQYTVRVDAPSLCNQPIANWKVRVVLFGTQIAAASGVAVDADTWGSHGPGSGVLALQFRVP